MMYGFRIVGSVHEQRRLVDHADAFAAYASLDPRAAVERESYLSAFTFDKDFAEHLQSTRSVRGFDGPCFSPWLWFDIDREDLDLAARDARRLSHWLIERYSLDDDALLCFFSGSKGFHFGVPSALWLPEPSSTFNRTCRRMAENLADEVAVSIDTGIYDKVRAFRAPNSRHPKTGLHKRQLSFDELTGLSLDAVRKLAEQPAPFDLPDAPPACDRAKADWQTALDASTKQAEAKASTGKATLNRATEDFLRNGAAPGDRARLLFSAAANLAEFGCPSELAHALLTTPARDSGLSPNETRRQIDCGLLHGRTGEA
jgi:hypothetical protein